MFSILRRAARRKTSEVEKLAKKDLINEKERDIMNLEKLPVNIPPEKFTEYA